MKRVFLSPFLILVLTWFTAFSSQAARSLRFVAGEKGEYRFDTGILKGALSGGGKAKGFTSVVYVPASMRLDRSMGILGAYRVFTTNHRYGTAGWDWPAESALQDDGSVTVLWRSTKERPFELEAHYTLPDPNALAVEFQVKAFEALPDFEVFVASYFDAPFTNSMVLAKPADGSAPRWISATSDRGDWQTFPRDDSVAVMFQDGRWKIKPNPVEWRLQEKFSKPMAMRRAGPTGLAAVLFSDASDCFAISTPHQTEGHYSVYFSLFGKTIRPGETATAKVRMQVSPDGK